ncbi:MAG: outer membrane beta-barrel protein [Turneriella sp.]|nr:outer membrane beta-barrel protein [Turneriella sp.]
MRKLLTIFSAAIFVGSLAAQKKAAPPPAPAAAPKAAQAEQPRPAPAAPAVTPSPSSTPTPAASSQSLGLSVEGYGLFTLARETSPSFPDGDTTSTTTYKLPGTMGFGGGLSLGYDIVEKLAVQLSFDYRSLRSRKWEAKFPAITTTTQNTYNTMWLGLGLRPRIQLGSGSIYAGAGLAVVLPWTSVTTAQVRTTAGTLVQDNETNENWNLGLGAYGELGYQYQVTDMVYVGLGVRLLVAASDNDGKKSETKDKVNNTTSVTEYASSIPAGSTKLPFQSATITDINFALSVGIRL